MYEVDAFGDLGSTRGSQGSCRILSTYWEAVPLPTARTLLTMVVGRLAADASSPVVRLGAVEGLSCLLEQPASHSVLKAMLPVRWLRSIATPGCEHVRILNACAPARIVLLPNRAVTCQHAMGFARRFAFLVAQACWRKMGNEEATPRSVVAVS